MNLSTPFAASMRSNICYLLLHLQNSELYPADNSSPITLTGFTNRVAASSKHTRENKFSESNEPLILLPVLSSFIEVIIAAICHLVRDNDPADNDDQHYPKY